MDFQIIDKNNISNKIIEVLLENRGKWKDLRVDDSSERNTFIDLTINTISLTIEVMEIGYINFRFDDGWSYFGGNPDDKSFKDFRKAIDYLKYIIDLKHTKQFTLEFKGRICQAYIELVSSDSSRQMGTENIYEISVDDVQTGNEVVVAEVSEYPMGIFSIFKKHPNVKITNRDITTYLREDDPDLY